MPAPAIAITTGEPAGIGPDICIAAAGLPHNARLLFLGDPDVIGARAAHLRVDLAIDVRESVEDLRPHTAGRMQMLPIRTSVPVIAGRLEPDNAGYVLELLGRGTDVCLEGACGALVTAPVQKSVIALSGHEFSGHTEFLAERTGTRQVVMLLASEDLRVALATTHLPLRDVADRITAPLLESVLGVLEGELKRLFGIDAPRILVLGLNPHAGENGTLGKEERDIIEPVLVDLRSHGMQVSGPAPADTAFTSESLAKCDAVLAMYHDQGLPALKARGFGEIVNVTLGLPIVRTSVDHGTALPLAGSGLARPDSLLAAIRLAAEMSARV